MIAPRLRAELDTRGEWAAQYAAIGWPILPTHGLDALGACTCGNARCDRPGKHPARTNYRQMATTDAPTLRSFWRLVPFNLSLRIPSGVLVLDVDDIAALRALTRFGAWPLTATHTTARGLRLFFAWDGAAPSIGGLDGTKLDILGADALCILPPSVSASGHRYAWRDTESPWELPLAPVPDAFAAHVRHVAARRAKPAQDQPDARTLEGALALARRRAKYAASTSNGAGRGAAGLRRALADVGAAPGIVAAALDVFHAEAGR